MSDTPPSDERPDPDALLQRVQAEEARARRGKLRIFFGFAPGVGKTYRMLQVARDLVSEQKIDLVIGLCETHRRMDTAALMLGLDLLPRRKIDHRGHVLEEFDLDAALRRRPQVLLLDELAHSNAPGSRHRKRWQDVVELLDAGIDVFTTVNVQHVESLNDVVAQITHVQVRETVPDSILDRADVIELVDISPEELLERLREGKVYLPEQARRAADHFFRRGNLLALRELALRRTAQRVDEDVLQYRAEHGVDRTWPAGERILVCVGAAPSSGRLIRAAARMAAGLRCPFTAVYVESPRLAPLGHEDRERLEDHLRLAEALGATVTRLASEDVAAAVLSYARRNNITRLIIGKPTHARLRDLWRGSLVDAIVRGSGDIDVEVIGGAAAAATAPRRDEAPQGPGASPQGYALALLLTALALGAALLLRRTLALPDPEMLFLLAVMLAAFLCGRGPALLSAGLGVLCYDFFFVPPVYTFAIADRRYILTFAMHFALGYAMSTLTGRLREQEREAQRREERTAGLYALSTGVAAAADEVAIAQVAARHAAQLFGATAIVFQEGQKSELRALAAQPAGAALDDRELAVAAWCLEHGRLAGQGTDTLPGATCLCAPLLFLGNCVGVLALRGPARTAMLGAEPRALLDVFGRLIAGAFERARLASEARAAALKARSEELRSSLLSSVSHDLRTPLGSITGAATALRDQPALDAATRAELIESICGEAERLERLVTNLLDMTRLQAGAVALKKDWVPIEEVVGAALGRLERRLGERPVQVTLAPELPLVSVDPVVLEQLFINLLDNAAKYTPPDTPIEIAAERAGASVVIEVRDRGPGLPAAARERVFDKFYRGAHKGITGAGLGLPICRGVAEAHGGTIAALPRHGGGAIFRVTLPIGGEPPALPAPEAEVAV